MNIRLKTNETTTCCDPSTGCCDEPTSTFDTGADDCCADGVCC